MRTAGQVPRRLPSREKTCVSTMNSSACKAILPPKPTWLVFDRLVKDSLLFVPLSLLANHQAISILNSELAGPIPKHLVNRHRRARRLTAREVDLQAVAGPLRGRAAQVWRAEHDSPFRFNLKQEERGPRVSCRVLCGLLTRRRTCFRGR